MREPFRCGEIRTLFSVVDTDNEYVTFLLPQGLKPNHGSRRIFR